MKNKTQILLSALFFFSTLLLWPGESPSKCSRLLSSDTLNVAAIFDLDLEPVKLNPGDGYSPYFFHNRGGVSRVSACTRIQDGAEVLHHRAIKKTREDIIAHEAAILLAANPKGDHSFLPQSYGIVELSTGEKVPEREFVRGTALNHAIHLLIHDPGLSVEEKIFKFFEFTSYAIQSLHDFHELGFLHGDYRPANIILRKDWETTNLSPTVIIDFSQALQRDLSNRTVLLKPLRSAFVAAFLAPEMAIDPKTGFHFENDDIFLREASLNYTKSTDYYYLAKSLLHLFKDLSFAPLEKGWPWTDKRKRYKKIQEALQLIEDHLLGQLSLEDYSQRPTNPLALTLQIQNRLLEILSTP